jgi:ABC-type Fe3+/spermidine/putrescine transport system ATPase subunit
MANAGRIFSDRREKQMEDKKIIVRLRGVVKRFDGDVVVNHLDLDIREGEFLTVLGPSGCGKTTTLRMLAGFETPDEGTVELEGKDVIGIPPNERDVNTVFQN